MYIHIFVISVIILLFLVYIYLSTFIRFCSCKLWYWINCFAVFFKNLQTLVIILMTSQPLFKQEVKCNELWITCYCVGNNRRTYKSKSTFILNYLCLFKPIMYLNYTMNKNDLELLFVNSVQMPELLLNLSQKI